MDPPKKWQRTEGSSEGHVLLLLCLLSYTDILELVVVHDVPLLAQTCTCMWKHFVQIAVPVGCTFEMHSVYLHQKEFACMHIGTLYMVLDRLLQLRGLHIESCTDLKVLPEEISNLRFLERLDVQKCTSLAALSPDISKLGALTYLRVENCPLQLLPNEIGSLQSLRELDLSICPELPQLPKNIGKLRNLASLALCWCEKLQHLPPSITTLPCLTNLDLRGCSSLKGVPSLPTVKKLVLACCRGLPRQMKLSLFPQLEDLVLGIWCSDTKFKDLMRLWDNRRSLVPFDPAVSSVPLTRDGRRSLIVEYDGEDYLFA